MELIGQMSLFESTEPTIQSVPLSEVDRELMRGSGFCGGKKRIYNYFRAEHTQTEKANFLKNEFDIGGHSALRGSAYNVDHDARGLGFRKGYHEKANIIPWTRIASRIDELIAAGIYGEGID
jgi:hypothetical protein